MKHHILVPAVSVNLYDVLNYPHVGKRRPGQHEGPPILFLLLNFALFVWLFKKYVWGLLVEEVSRRGTELHHLIEASERMESDARAKFDAAQQRSLNLEFERRHIVETIHDESLHDVEGILSGVVEYEESRERETKQQITLKQAAVDKLLREEIILAVVRRSRELVPTMITPAENEALIREALDESKIKRRGLYG